MSEGREIESRRPDDREMRDSYTGGMKERGIESHGWDEREGRRIVTQVG